MDEHRAESLKTAAVSAADFRAACGLFPTGVTVVTRRRPDGRAYGMTVSSFTSVSLDPPLILVCIERRSGLLKELQAGSYFAVNVLSEAQQSLASRFSRQREDERFSGVEWTEGPHHVPLLAGSVADFICSVHNLIPAGDHLILVGTTEQINRHGGNALVWCQSAYHCLPGPSAR